MAVAVCWGRVVGLVWGGQCPPAAAVVHGPGSLSGRAGLVGGGDDDTVSPGGQVGVVDLDVEVARSGQAHVVGAGSQRKRRAAVETIGQGGRRRSRGDIAQHVDPFLRIAAPAGGQRRAIPQVDDRRVGGRGRGQGRRGGQPWWRGRRAAVEGGNGAIVRQASRRTTLNCFGSHVGSCLGRSPRQCPHETEKQGQNGRAPDTNCLSHSNTSFAPLDVRRQRSLTAPIGRRKGRNTRPFRASLPVSYTHLRAHETVLDLVCRLLLATHKSELQ